MNQGAKNKNYEFGHFFVKLVKLKINLTGHEKKS